tara:strand:- start:180 stop:1499 length:1320 start_codon:yes stop_codon:yes gene_type:complete
LSKTAIVGLGKTGVSCLRHLYGKTDLIVVDSRENPPAGAESRKLFKEVDYRLGINRLDCLGIDQVIVSPGVGLDSPLVAPAVARELPIKTDIDLFCENTKAPICAITGTNGKSTVTSLVGHLLETAGYDVGVGGNLGRPALDLLENNNQLYVLELSSFQLEYMSNFEFSGASILNISEDHIDRHGSYELYVSIKQKIYRNSSTCVFNRHDPLTKPLANGYHVSFGADDPDTGNWGIRGDWLVLDENSKTEQVISVNDLPLKGKHNVLNVLAAFALARVMGLNTKSLTSGIETFGGLPHRCQYVTDRSGIRFYNDSKATNVGASIAAIKALGSRKEKNVVLIAGGDSKNANLSPLKDPVSRHVKAAILLGKDAALMEAEIGSLVPTVCVESIFEAVKEAVKLSISGDVVLLSPACTSLDMFSSFEARGEEFVESIKQVSI